MRDVLWELISNFLITIAQAFIYLNLFEEVLGLKNQKYKTFYYLISAAAVYFCNKPFINIDFAGYSVWIYIIQIITLYICIKIFLKGRLLESLLLIILSFVLDMLPQIIFLMFTTLVLNINIETYTQPWSSTWLFMAAVMVTLPYIFSRIAIAVFKKKRPSFPINQVLMLTAYDIFMIVLGAAFLSNKKSVNESDLDAKVLAIWFTIAIISVGVVACVYFILSKKLSNSKFNLWVSENKFNEQRRQMKDIKEQEQQIRKIRHDFKNHITTGLALMREGKIQEADDYFSEYLDSEIIESKQYINTDYDALNAIVNKKIGVCFEKDIKVSTAISAELGSIAEMDLCIVLFNLFDNAIEACEKIESDKFIKLDIFQNKSYLVVSIQNSAEEGILVNNPKLETTKKDDKNHGIGLNTVKDIVKRYNGIFKTEEENSMFTVDVWLDNRS